VLGWLDLQSDRLICDKIRRGFVVFVAEKNGGRRKIREKERMIARQVIK